MKDTQEIIRQREVRAAQAQGKCSLMGLYNKDGDRKLMGLEFRERQDRWRLNNWGGTKNIWKSEKISGTWFLSTRAQNWNAISTSTWNANSTGTVAGLEAAKWCSTLRRVGEEKTVWVGEVWVGHQRRRMTREKWKSSSKGVCQKVENTWH